MHKYCFDQVDGSIEAQWKAVRKYFETWRGCSQTGPAANRGDNVPPKSFSISEWERLADVLVSNNRQGVMRDFMEFKQVPGHEATSVMWQAEGDFIWAVANKEWHSPNPSVAGYIMDYDASDGSFTYAGRSAANLAELALVHSSHFSNDLYANALVSAPGGADWFAEIQPCFQVSARIGDSYVLETDDVLCVLFPTPLAPDSHHLSVSVMLPSGLENIPKPCMELLGSRGTFSGQFAKSAFRKPLH